MTEQFTPSSKLTGLSRRQFLGSTSVAAGGALAMGTIGPLTPAQAAAHEWTTTVPLLRREAHPKGRHWTLTSTTRIVTPAELVAEAETLDADLVTYGLIDRAPEVVVGTRRTARDLVLERGFDAVEGGYQIETHPIRGVRIRSNSDAGIYYGGRAVLQLLLTDASISPGVMESVPALPHRGVMIDCGRKYYSKEWFEDLIVRLGWLGLNYLHMHLTDNEGFRFGSKAFPQIVSADHLTLEELAELVEFGQRHHVTLVPELDAPGHLRSLTQHFPDYALRTKDGNGSRRSIDVSNPDAVAMIYTLIDELLPVFTGPYWHMGGDEVLHIELGHVSEEVIDSNYPHLVEYAAGRVGEGAHASDAVTLFLNDLDDYLRSHGKQTRAWNDGMQSPGKVQINTTIDVDYWENLRGRLKTPQDHLAEGHRVLNAHSRFFYYIVAASAPSWYPRPNAERIYRDWSIELFEGSQDALVDAPPQVYGAHMCAWADKASEQTLEQVAEGIRQPLVALAQRTWTTETRPVTTAEFVAILNALPEPVQE